MTDPKKIFLALPTMGTYNHGLLDKLTWFSMNPNYRVMWGKKVGELFHDAARNKLCQDFLRTDCEWLLFIDADVDPSPNILDLTNYDKDIIGAHVFAWMGKKLPDGQVELDLYSSIWDRADCEECKAVEQFKKDGTNKDPREYRIKSDALDMLERWNPLTHTWTSFCDRATGQQAHCRCHGTGRDPIVYNCSPKIMEKAAPIQVDAVGAAAMMIRRNVIESIKPPWFQFLYREMRDVMVTEDLVFCVRAKEHGFEVWADQFMPCRHFKEVDLLGVNQWGGRLVEQAVKTVVENQRNKRIIIPGAPALSGAFR